MSLKKWSRPLHPLSRRTRMKRTTGGQRKRVGAFGEAEVAEMGRASGRRP